MRDEVSRWIADDDEVPYLGLQQLSVCAWQRHLNKAMPIDCRDRVGTRNFGTEW